MRTIDDVEFEAEEQHRKAMRTEDAAIRIVRTWAKQHGAFVRPRVVPRFWNQTQGEIDALLIADIGLVIVEVKRWGGALSVVPGGVEVHAGKTTKQLANPAEGLARTVERVRAAIANDRRWQPYAACWAGRASAPTVPVTGIVVFGPSTTGHESLATDGIVVTSTRKLRGVLSGLASDRARVLGSVPLGASATALWGQQGKLTVRGRKGFARVHIDAETIPFPANAGESDRHCTLVGVREVACTGKGKVNIRYFGSSRAVLGRCDAIPMTAWFNDAPRLDRVLLPTDRSFSWRALDA